MYDWGKEQEKEIATIKERTIYQMQIARESQRMQPKQISQYHNYWKVLLEIL